MGRSTLRRWNGPVSNEERRHTAFRTAQWSAYFNRFYGGTRGGDRVPGEFAPVSYREATRILAAVVVRGAETQQAKADPQRIPLGRTVSQMLLAGYGPSDAPDAYRQVVCRAAGVRPDSDDPGALARAEALAVQKLRQGTETEFPKETPFRRQTFSLTDELDREGRGRQQPVSPPSEIFHRGDAFSVRKTVYFRQPLTEGLKQLVNPVSWTQLGEYFTHTKREDGRTGTKPWSGVLHEKFAVNWNGFTTQTFDQRLRVEFTVAPTIARTDYLLMYDADDQLALNEGYFEARQHSEEFEDWMSVTMVKTVKFASSALNMMAPAILTMFLDSKAGGFRAFAAKGAPRGANGRSA